MKINATEIAERHIALYCSSREAEEATITVIAAALTAALAASDESEVLRLASEHQRALNARGAKYAAYYTAATAPRLL